MRRRVASRRVVRQSRPWRAWSPHRALANRGAAVPFGQLHDDGAEPCKVAGEIQAIDRHPGRNPYRTEIGRASCRERVENAGVEGAVERKEKGMKYEMCVASYCKVIFEWGGEE